MKALQSYTKRWWNSRRYTERTTKGDENRYTKISRYQHRSDGSKLFDTEKECDEIKKNKESITKYVESGKDTSVTLPRELKNSEDRQKKAENELEK